MLKDLKNELYKVYMLFRLLGVIFLAYGESFALLYINIEEIFFFIVYLTVFK